MVKINCSHCQKEVEVNKKSIKFCSPECKKEKQLAGARNWKKNNSVKNKEITKEWKSKNKTYISAYNSTYNLNNRKQIQDRQTIQHRERRKTDLSYKLATNCRNRIKKFYRGEHKSNKLLDCSHIFLVKWFHYLNPQLTIQNYGFYGWHMDHFIPCALFNLENEDELKQCFHWTNIQPLDGQENMRKQDNITKEEIEIFEQKLNKFVTENNIIIPKFDRYKYLD